MKKYRIADIIVEMESFGQTEARAEPYRIEDEKKAEFIVCSNWNKIKKDYPTISDEMGEYLSTGKSFYQQLIKYDGLMLHASAVVVNEKAYLFSAKSGVGKSTHTALWMKLFENEAYILNDDKPALRFVEGEWYAYGTPWSGKNDLSVNVGVPIAGIAFLKRSLHNKIKPFAGREMIVDLFGQINRKTTTKEFRIKMLELLDLLVAKIPIWKLECNTDIEAAIMAYEAMSAEPWRNEYGE